MSTTSTPVPVSTEELADRFLKTYRYLRVAMVGLVVVLAAAVGRELFGEADGRLMPSISSYYYSPARAIFVGVLISIGVCLVVLKGNTPWEDTFLNVAGMLSPVVALVPTPDTGTCTGGVGVPAEVSANVANNVFALLLGGVAGLVATYTFARSGGQSLAPRHPVGAGLWISTALWVGGVLWFAFGRGSFACQGHNVAAITMFAFIVLVVGWNAWGYAGQDASQAGRNRYGLLAGAMVLAAPVLGLLTWRGVLANGVFWIEATLITLFAVFWALQTRELWQTGLRGATPRA